MSTLEGGCACGLVRFQATGTPIRVGLCHCMTCRRYHGTAFNAFVIFSRECVTIEGPRLDWRSSSHATRTRCAGCGSPIAMLEDGSTEIELNVGSFDEPSLFVPLYENWILRRE